MHGDEVRMLLPPLSPGGKRLLLEGHARDGTLEGALESGSGRGMWRASRLSTEVR